MTCPGLEDYEVALIGGKKDQGRTNDQFSGWWTDQVFDPSMFVGERHEVDGGQQRHTGGLLYRGARRAYLLFVSQIKFSICSRIKDCFFHLNKSLQIYQVNYLDRIPTKYDLIALCVGA
jgi:hypothetical protein